MPAEAPAPSPVVPASVRRRLAEDAGLGAGSALRRALEVSPAPGTPFFLAGRPIPLPGGRSPTELSLAEADEAAQGWSCWYLERGIGPRDRIAVYLDESFEYLLHFFALTQIGAIPVLINGRMPAAPAAALCRRTGAAGVMADRAHLDRLEPLLEPPRPRWLQATGEVAVGSRRLPDGSRYRHASADPVLICHSSGTTGIPKAAIWTHGQAIAGYRDQLARPAGPRAHVLLLALPASHAAGVAFAVLAMLVGTRLALPQDADGATVARAIERFRPTTVVGFAGTHAELATLPPDTVDFESVETWISIGDAAHQAHIGRLVRSGRHWIGGEPRPGSIFVDGFGSSEVGWGIFNRATVQGEARADRCLGLPQAYAEAAVLRRDGTRAEPHEVGLLGVRGPTVSAGYWDDSELTYRSQLAGFWLSGDLVYRDELGRFYHVDRTTDPIPLDGGTAYSLLLEEALLADLPEVLDCTVVAGDGGPSAIVRLASRGADRAELLRRANEFLERRGQPRLAGLEIADTDAAIPIGVTRKVLKRQLRERRATPSEGTAGEAR